MGRLGLRIAIFVALVLASAAVVLRSVVDAGSIGAGGGRPLSDQLPLLFAAAGLCVAGLLRRRAPSGAWLASVSVAAIAAIVVLGAVRSRLAVDDPQWWPALVLIGQGALLAAAGVAGAYAVRSSRGRRGRRRAAWLATVLAALSVVAVSGALAFAEVPAEARLASPLPPELPMFRVSARLAAAFIAVMALAGIWRDLSGPVGRARARSASLVELPRTIGEELLPNANAARRHGRNEERARIAADLHALVLPDLRRAAQIAEAAEAAETAEDDRSGGAPAPSTGPSRPVAADLRHAVEGVERLMHQRQSVVLEEYGLVAGLEWLAERTQQRAAIVVDIELEGSQVADRGAVTPPVARAAFRVALLALDNVVRHSGASRALVRLDVESGRGRLAIVDDGRGIEDSTASRSGRGLIDMRTAATEVGATMIVERGDRGTAVEMAWAGPMATAEDPATRAADLTARPSAPHA